MQTVIMSSVNEIFATVLTGIALYVAVKVRAFVGAKLALASDVLDEQSRKRIEAALDNAIAAAQANVSHVTINDVIGYVQKMNPGDLARLNLRGTKLIEKIEIAIAARGAGAVKS